MLSRATGSSYHCSDEKATTIRDDRGVGSEAILNQ